MAILVERRLRGRFAPVGGSPLRERRTRDLCAERDCLEIALVNNMPDTALEATELQFLDLLRSAAVGRMVRIKFYSVPGVPRAELGQGRLQILYSDIAELWNSRVDAVLVTGAEPRTAALADEPYWKTLADLFDWAEENTVASVWSCLAAHAAVQHIDGIARRPLGQKCSGVFDCSKVSEHPIVRRTPPGWRVPHSRGNGLGERELAACGYEVLTRSAEVGVDTFLKQRRSLFLFFQGHPEYDADTLLREYRRDVGRFLRGERDVYPEMPSGYFDETTAAPFRAFRERALRERTEALIEAFPAAAIEPGFGNAWRQPAARIYRNWLRYVATRRRAERALVPRQPAPRTASGRRAAGL